MKRKRVVKTSDAASASSSPPVAADPEAEMPELPPRRPVFSGDGLANLVAALGTSRDKRSFTTYTQVTPPNITELENTFQSSWVGGRIVTTLADDMTREWVDVSWEGHDKDVAGAKAVRDAEAEFDLKGKANEALTWARLHGGCVIFVGIKDEMDHSKPLVMESIKKDSLQLLHVLDRWRIVPATNGKIDKDRNSPNYGRPLQFQLTEAEEGVGTIHWTRLIRFDGRKLPYQAWRKNGMWDASELQHVMDNIKDYDATRAGIAAMIWEANVDILKASGVALELSTPEGTTRVNNRLVNGLTMKSFLKTWVIDKDTEDFTQKNVHFAGVVEVLREFVTDICGAADISVTRLFGQSPSGLTTTGESDIRNYYNGVASKQQTQLRKQVRKLYELLLRSVLGRMPENFDITFRPLWQLSATDQADIDYKRAQTDDIYLNQGVATEGLVMRELKARNLYRTATDRDVKLAEELSLEPEPEAVAAVVKKKTVAKKKPGKGVSTETVMGA